MYHFLTTQFSPPPNPTSRLEPNPDSKLRAADMDAQFAMRRFTAAPMVPSQRKMVLGGTAARILKL